MKSLEDFKPMLSGTLTQPEQLRWPMYASCKYDGIRAYVQKGVLLSRNAIPIPNPYVQSLFGDSKFDGLDGELVVGSAINAAAFRKTGSFVMSHSIAQHRPQPKVYFHVFDDFSRPEAVFTERYRRLCTRVKRYASLRLVPQSLITSVGELDGFEEGALEAGYEGVMLRAPESPYKFGRSTEREGWLLKVKRFSDGEAQVIGFEELGKNTNVAERDNLGRVKRSSAKSGLVMMNTLGSLLVRDLKTNVEFNVGSGFTADERRKIWKARDKYMNWIARYKFFAGGSKDKPRFPVFTGWRSRADL